VSRRNRADRDDRLQGLLLVDKPMGYTSHDVCAVVKSRMRLAKVGHGGTLDPFATGLLPLMLNGATRLMPLLVKRDKTYRALVRFGWATDTLDRTGETLATGDPSGLDRAAIDAAIAPFVGPITQTIPYYSAAKVEGKRLYEYARAGTAVERPTKEVVIHSIDVLGLRAGDGTLDLDLRVACGSGTYIRTLADDLGRALSVPAHLTELRREITGPFSVEHAVPLEDIKAAGDADKVLRDAAREEGTPLPFDAAANSACWTERVGAALRPVADLVQAPVVRPPQDLGLRLHNGSVWRKEDLARVPGLPDRYVPGDRIVVEDEAGVRTLAIAKAAAASEALSRLPDRAIVFEVERVLR